MSLDPGQAALAAFLGLLFGSLASALSHRLPRGLPVFADRSRCPACGTPLTPLDLVPLLSWLLNRGRCRHCGAGVSWRYPVIELTTAAIFVAALAAGGGSPLLTATLALTGFALVVIVVADLEERIIPDAMVILLLIAGLAWRWQAGDWIDGLAGAATGLLLSLGLRWAFLRWRGVDALGLGDVKFLGVAGIYLGVTDLAHFLVLAGVGGMVLGLVWRRLGHGEVFPFGPALCASLAVLLWEKAPLVAEQVVTHY